LVIAVTRGWLRGFKRVLFFRYAVMRVAPEDMILDPRLDAGADP
jgi:hypothetical protein